MGGLEDGRQSPGRRGGHPPTLPPEAAQCHRTRPPSQGGAPTTIKPGLAGRQQPTFPPSGGMPPDAPSAGASQGLRGPSKPPSGGGSPPARRRNGRRPLLPGRPAGNVGTPVARQGKWFGACAVPRRLQLCRGARSAPRPIPRHRAHEGRVDRHLGTLPQRQPIGEDLYAARVRQRHVNVHVTQQNICRHTGPIRAAARSKGAPRGPRTPATRAVARVSSAATTRLSTTRMQSDGMRSSGAVGSAVMAREPPGPAWPLHPSMTWQPAEGPRSYVPPACQGGKFRPAAAKAGRQSQLAADSAPSQGRRPRRAGDSLLAVGGCELASAAPQRCRGVARGV